MRKFVGLGAVALMAAGASMAMVGPASATPRSANPTPITIGEWAEYNLVDGHKVTFCHRTGSESNPYVVVTADIAAVNSDGSSDHQSHEQVSNGLGPDIIPISEDVKREYLEKLKQDPKLLLCDVVEEPPSDGES